MKKLNAFLALVASATITGCADSNAPGQALSLSFAGRVASTASVAGVMAAPAAATADELVIDKAQAVVRKIRLESAVAVAGCDDDDVSHSDGCEEIKAGPVLVDIPTEAGATTEVTVEVPNGTYDELKVQLHKVSGNDPAEADFRAANPDFVDKSIRVTGTFNGTLFTFATDLTAVLQFHLDPPLEVTDQTASTNLTVNFSLDEWFRTADGALIDPATANKGGPNEQLVKNSIRRSLRAFEDQDRDGEEDDDRRGHGNGHNEDEHHSGDDSSGHRGGNGSQGGHGSDGGGRP